MPTNDYALELSPDLDPETAAELRKLRRQQEMAKAMYERGMQPMQGQMIGGVYVRPSITQGLSNLANAYMYGQEQKGIDEGYKALGEKRKAAEEAATQALMRGTMGTPERTEELPPDTFGPPQTFPAVTPTPEQRKNAMIEAMVGNSPKARRTAEIMFKIDEANVAKKAALEQRMHELQLKIEDSRVAREDRLAAQKELMQMRLEGQKELRAMAGAMRQQAQPYFSPFDSSQGAMVFDHRTGKMVPATVDGKPLVKAASDPALQGQIAGAKEAGQAKAKRALNMAGLGDTIDEAKALLSGTSGKALPTGSTVGTLVDAAAGLVGASPEGSAEAQTLKAIGGALTSKMPRMEGPQSDKDTQLYREMAAVVGDSTVPRDRRLAALDIVEKLWGKYAPSDGNSPNPPKTDGALTPEEQKELDALRKRFNR